MGVPTTATYCIMAATCAPILIRMGVPAIAAHYFVFYFGIVADITPPVALAAYAGAAIAKANPMKTAFRASQLAIAAFIVPYVICYNPALILVNSTPLDVIVVTCTTLVGLFALGAAFEGYLFVKVPVILRIVFAIGGLMLIAPETVTDIIGLVLVFGSVFIQYRMSRTPKAAAA